MNLPGELATLNFVDFSRHLWRRRYVLLAAPALVVILAYLFIRLVVGETFEATAVIMVRTPPTEILPTQKALSVESPVYEDILSSDELLHRVIREGREAFPDQIPDKDFERLRQRFRVRIITTVDTTVRTEYSPVISMRARGSTRESTYFLADRWLQNAVERYGKLRIREAQSAQAAYQGEFDRLSSEVQELQAREVELEEALRAVSQRAAARSRVLYGSPATRQDPVTGGLIEERAALEIELSAGGGEEERAQARIAAIDGLMERLEGELEELARQKATLERELGDVRNGLITARERMAEARVILTRVSSDSVALSDPAYPDMEGDFVVLSRPVMPERRVAPPRTVLAILIGIGFGFLLLFLILLEWFVHRAILEHEPA